MRINRNEIIDKFPCINRLHSSNLRELCRSLFIHVFQNSPYSSIEQAYHFPEARNFAKYILVDHINQVSELCEEICAKTVSCMKLTIDHDIVLAGALLHDIDKYCIFNVYDSGEIEKKTNKVHAVEGAKMARIMKIPEPICHVIESHSRIWAPVSPSTKEAVFVRSIDEIVCELYYLNSFGYSFDVLIKKANEYMNGIKSKN